MTWFEWTSLVCVSAPAKAGVTVGEDGAIEDGCGGQVLDGSGRDSQGLAARPSAIVLASVAAH